MDQIGFADTVTSRCTYYRRTCGLPAGIQPQTGRIVLRVGVVGAITMPATLGLRVRDDLLHRRNILGPIISHLRSRRWTYLVRPDLPQDLSLFAEMFRLDVSIVPVGGEIALPSPQDAEAGFRQWIAPPRDTFRPSGRVIIDQIGTTMGRGPLC
ncbi:DNA-directed RNA polymerase subunit beta [Nocardia terpenica]|uniref:DNA-directed RNA polymerase subunit beta n=1 Tax=Nocardia terpenica TaxID=455432 RepID=A0A6G9YYR5_9NOCA|nr:DNA-directed RNA polymerase subunit beta [Nocardia terpenica]